MGHLNLVCVGGGAVVGYEQTFEYSLRLKGGSGTCHGITRHTVTLELEVEYGWGVRGVVLHGVGTGLGPPGRCINLVPNAGT